MADEAECLPMCAEWNNETFVDFAWAATNISSKLGIGKGVAENTLRELCGKGDIRSIRYKMFDTPEEMEGYLIYLDQVPGHAFYVERTDFMSAIEPSRWLTNKVDLECSEDERGIELVGVSLGDIQAWIGQQTKPKGPPIAR